MATQHRYGRQVVASFSLLLSGLILAGCYSSRLEPEQIPVGPLPEKFTPSAGLPQPSPSIPELSGKRRALPPFWDEQKSPLPASIERVTSRGLDLTFLLFDERSYHLSVADKKEGPDTEWPTAESAAMAHGALAAINASFFDAEGAPLGLVIENGRRIGKWNSNSSLASGVFAMEKRPRLLRRQHWRSFSPTRHLIQAGPFLVENDIAVDGLENQKRSPRSFLAWDGGSRWALGYAAKASLAELAAALAAQPVTQLEITTALNLDGGRSSDLWVSAEVPGGPLNTRTLWNRPVRNYLLLHRQSR